ncbi:MAG: FAD-dependent oxidoreductase [Gammaproteobacteria bacterium]|nr:FAD-dependent oxidoreductase [Gammaproteobacteria bacterium]MCP4984072.1 FAD-dependent oxidoreductase [Gammaproteobacteria bacterium]
MKSSYQLLVIGAGPAGMAAAQAAARSGVEVAVVDEQSQPGGQIYRNVDSSPLADINLLGKDFIFGKQLVQAFRHAPIDYFPDTAVWYLDKNREAGIIEKGVIRRVSAQYVIIACGAQERPMPFPGWSKPGVMTAGAGQILLKSAAMVPGQSPVLAGSGPLLLLLAWQYLRAGIGVSALLDTTPKANRWRAMRRLPAALAASDYLFKGFKLMASIRHARVPWYRQVTDLRVESGECLQCLSFKSYGKTRQIETRLLLLHEGVIPALHITEATGCETLWNEAQQSWQARLDPWGQSSQGGIFVVGDGATIGGARAASLSGQIAGLRVAHQLGRIEQAELEHLARPIRNARQRHLAIRPFLDSYYRVAEDRVLPDETLVCRCEEVTAAEIRSVAALGCMGPNQAKAFTRCGMGPCQGRFCGRTLEDIFAQERDQAISQIGRFSARPPIKPVTLGQLADSEES